MTVGFLDILTNTFVAALLGGFQILHGYALPLLALLGGLALLGFLIPQIMEQNIAAILAGLLFMLFYLSVFHYLATNMQHIAMAFFNQFVAWGSMVGGGQFGPGDFLSPSTVMTTGFKIVFPILEAIKRFSLIKATANAGTILVLFGAMVIIVLAFAWATKDIIMAILQFYFALLALPVLLPWGVLTYTRMFFDLGVTWILSACIRLFLLSAALGIGKPLIESMALTFTPGGDPSLFSACMIAVGAGIYAVLIHEVAKRSTLMGMSGSALMPRGLVSMGMAAVSMGWGGLAAAGGAAVRRASQALRSQQSGGYGSWMQ